MRKNNFYFLIASALAFAVTPACGTTTSVSTIPNGVIAYPLTHGTTSYLSLPLTNRSTYTGQVTAVTTNSVSVDDSPAPFTTDMGTAAAPYFVKFLSGNESGRVLLVDSNSTTTLVLDTTDHATGSAVALTTTSFNVQVGDTFEIFPGDTLSSVLGAGTSQSPLVLSGGSALASADTVALFTTVGAPAITYFFNTVKGYWVQYGTTANANNTIIYPYSAFTIARRSTNADTTLIVSGRVTPVPATTKVVGKATVYTSTQYATNIKLSQLNFGSNWLTGNVMSQSDNISVWNATLSRFDTYFQKPDLTWRKYPDSTTDQSSFAITAGTVTTIAKRAVVTGAASFLKAGMPYTLN